MTTGNIYLNFNGNCEEAFSFYKSVYGGQVAMPMQNTFWEDYFGMWTDKFGVNCMISYAIQDHK